MYISIDGDDIGRKLAQCFLTNDEVKLKETSEVLDHATNQIAELLTKHGFEIVFCAADGITARKDHPIDFEQLFARIRELAPNSLSYSAGVGDTLRESFIALLSSKCSGKNKLTEHIAIPNINE